MTKTTAPKPAKPAAAPAPADTTDKPVETPIQFRIDMNEPHGRG